MATRKYQYGNLTLRRRMKGPDVWQFRWTENGRMKSMLIGTVGKLPTKADAERAVEHLRLKINTQNPQSQFHSVTVAGMIEHYISEEIPNVRADTAASYLMLCNKWIRPRWGDHFLEEVKTAEVERWLKAIKRAPGTKAHIRGLMHSLFNCAIRWEMFDKNPITLVRQSQKHVKELRVPTPEEFRKLLAELQDPYYIIVLIAGCLGLRISEILALKWCDVDWEGLTIFVRRSTVAGKIYETKTPASHRLMPIDPQIAEALLMYRRKVVYASGDDFIFAGDNGKPRWQGIMLTDHIKPAALRAGIGKVGWHMFRHMFSTILHDAGTNTATQRELLRHANITTTLGIYTHAISDKKRKAVGQVAEELLGKK